MPESNRKRRTPAGKLGYWRKQVAAWRESGLSRAAYCRREAVSASSLGHWVRRFAREPENLSTPEVIDPPPGRRQLTPLDVFLANDATLNLSGLA